MEQKLKEYLVETEAYFKAQGRAREIKEDRPRSYAASIDRTGSKIELKWTETDTDGSEVKLAYYLTKQK